MSASQYIAILITSWHVGGRMLVVFKGRAGESEVGIDEGDLGEGSRCSLARKRGNGRRCGEV
jgi:hypothetical protein